MPLGESWRPSTPVRPDTTIQAQTAPDSHQQTKARADAAWRVLAAEAAEVISHNTPGPTNRLCQSQASRYILVKEVLTKQLLVKVIS